MTNGYQGEILKIYENIREQENKEVIKRREEIEKRLPLVIEIEKRIGKLSLETSMSIFKDIKNREEYLKKLKEKITDLQVKKSETLVQNGYPMDYLEHHYKCSKCKDTGFIVTEKCLCYKQKLVDIYYKNSDLKDLLKTNNFDFFNFEYYSSKKGREEHESPRKNIEKAVDRAWNFIKDFQNAKENLLFYGNSGTGKTFLSNCVAKELLDKGHLVVYRTAEELIKNLRVIKFEENVVLEDLIINCDLLIIDDLGTEQINDFTKTELYNLLNKKLLREKKMIVSTNYTLEDLLKNYSERISSRLIGNFTPCKFFGDDIRIKKNLSRARA